MFEKMQNFQKFADNSFWDLATVTQLQSATQPKKGRLAV
jgi:hypothetical protein